VRNGLKTAMLLGGLSAIVLVLGSLFGRGGLVIALERWSLRPATATATPSPGRRSRATSTPRSGEDPEAGRGPTPRCAAPAGATVRPMRLAIRQTARLTRVFLLADQEAARDDAARLGTAHLLLALVRDEHEHGGRLADRVDVGEVRAEVARRPFRRRGTGRRAWTPAAVAAVDVAVRGAEAVVGVRHLLLGVLSDDADDADDAAAVLRALDVDVDDLVTAARADLRADIADIADIAVPH
jgi:hypothetical protein